jgi:hypothetical protein
MLYLLVAVFVVVLQFLAFAVDDSKLQCVRGVRRLETS